MPDSSRSPLSTEPPFSRMINDIDEQQQQQLQSTESASPYCQCDACLVEELHTSDLKQSSCQQHQALVDLLGDEEAVWCYSWQKHWSQHFKEEAEEEKVVQADDIDTTAELEDHPQQLEKEEEDEQVSFKETPSFSADVASNSEAWYSYGNSSTWRQLWWKSSTDEEEEKTSFAAAVEEVASCSSPPGGDHQQLFSPTTTAEEAEEEPRLSERGQLVAQDLAALRQLLTTSSSAFAQTLQADLATLEQTVLSPLVKEFEQKTVSLMASAQTSLEETANRWQAGGRQLRRSASEGAEGVIGRLDRAAEAITTFFSGTVVRVVDKLATEVAEVARQAASVLTEIDPLEASSTASMEFSFSSSSSSSKHHNSSHQQQQSFFVQKQQQQKFSEADLQAGKLEEGDRSGPLKRLVAWLVTKLGPTDQSTVKDDFSSLADWPRSSGLSEGR